MNLGQKVGPFPLGGWAAIVAAGAGAGYLLRRTGLLDGAPSAEPEPDLGDSDGFYSPGSTVPGGIGSSGSGATTPPVAVDPGAQVAPVITRPTTNAGWLGAAVTALVAAGVSPTTADTALRKYLGGDKVSQAEKVAIDSAIAAFGAPPEGAPPLQTTEPEVATNPVPPAPQPARVTPATALGKRWTSTQGNGETLHALALRLYGNVADTKYLVKFNPALAKYNTPDKWSRTVIPPGRSIVY